MITAIVAIVFGLLIGSFLNVCIYRWPRDLSVVRPRSHCPACDEPIAWYDNIPLVSYLALGGRCRHCRARISIRYPAVELLTAALFAYFALKTDSALPALKMCVLAAIAIGLIFSDWEERILPDELTLGGMVAGLAFAAVTPMTAVIVPLLTWATGMQAPDWANSLAESAIGAFVPTAFLWAAGWLYEKIRHRPGLGFGDVKLMAMVGSFLGLSGSLMTLFLGSIAGSILGYGYIRWKKKDPATYELPFGAFLGAAAVVVAIIGQGA